MSLKGHSSEVTCVQFLEKGDLLVSAAADGQINVWKRINDNDYKLLQEFGDHHQQSVTTLTAATGTKSSVFVSGSSDGHLSFWAIDPTEVEYPVSLINDIEIGLTILPLASAITALPLGESLEDEYVVAVGNTSRYTNIYVGSVNSPFKPNAKLEGQGDWVRSLAFSRVQENGNILLATGCQDRYIRIWSLSQGFLEQPATADPSSMEYDEATGQLSNKIYTLQTSTAPYSMKFDALIIGHDDWIYSLKWHPTNLSLMSSSADSSIMIWTPDEHSGVWLSSTQLGDITIKGASTATGAYGGMWFSSWIGPKYSTIVSLSNTGAWKCWREIQERVWEPATGLSGQIKNVTDIDWSTDGKYILTTSLDKTTRLYAPWLTDPNTPKNHKNKWYELARPQIHGYDMISVKSLSPGLFISAGDEKVLRVFTTTKATANLINNTVGQSIDIQSLTSASATVPALGLSNKAIAETKPNDIVDDIAEEDQEIGTEPVESVDINQKTPPLEDQLQRLTLWPEVEKIYGHGYEVTTIGSSYDKTIVVSSCKANSKDHAVIRITDTETWQKDFEPLSFHTLTITGLQFSPDDKYLLSVSRDRSWALWERRTNPSGNSLFTLSETNKLHSRIIWDCCWANVPGKNYYFFTGSRDKSVKIWTNKREELSTETSSKWTNIKTILFKDSVTAVDVKYFENSGKYVLAAGLDNGDIYIVEMTIDSKENVIDLSQPQKVDSRLTPASRVNTIIWNPNPQGLSRLDSENEKFNLLAFASEDHSARVLKIK